MKTIVRASFLIGPQALIMEEVYLQCQNIQSLSLMTQILTTSYQAVAIIFTKPTQQTKRQNIGVKITRLSSQHQESEIGL